jgi:hypothetical protein
MTAATKASFSSVANITGFSGSRRREGWLRHDSELPDESRMRGPQSQDLLRCRIKRIVMARHGARFPVFPVYAGSNRLTLIRSAFT